MRPGFSTFNAYPLRRDGGRANSMYIQDLKRFFLYLMPVLYILAGVNHFLNPSTYMKIMPPWLPVHLFLVFLSGICEVGLGILLCFPATRKFAAWGLIFLLVAVFPANIQMMLNYRAQHHPQLWLAVLRLPLQGLLILWAYQYTQS